MRHQVRIKYSGAIFAAILFVLLIGVLELSDSDRLASMAPPDRDVAEPVTVAGPVEIQQESDCTQMESDFAAKVEESRSCQVDTDCSLTRLECPFECVSAVSASLVDELKGEDMAFQNACGWCESTCPQALTKWRAACVRERCIVLDRSIDDLEEATLEFINEPG